jgi:hypothetical protein
MERKVTYYLDGKGRVFLHYIWDGDALGAFKSGFFPKDMNVEIIPKEENVSNEDLLMVEISAGRKLLLKIGDGIFRSYEWKSVKKTYKDKKLKSQITLLKTKRVSKVNNEIRIGKIIYFKEKGKTVIKPGMIRIAEYENDVSLDKRVESETKDQEF